MGQPSVFDGQNGGSRCDRAIVYFNMHVQKHPINSQLYLLVSCNLQWFVNVHTACYFDCGSICPKVATCLHADRASQ